MGGEPNKRERITRGTLFAMLAGAPCDVGSESKLTLREIGQEIFSE